MHIIHRTTPNGNCFFECVKIILKNEFNENVECSDLRYATAKYLTRNYKKYNILFLLKLHLSGEANFEYFKNVKKSETLQNALLKIYENIVNKNCWADALLIQVISDILRLDFKINNTYYITNKYNNYSILKYDGSHYDVISIRDKFIFRK